MSLDVNILNPQVNEIYVTPSSNFSVLISEKSPISVEITSVNNSIEVIQSSNVSVEIIQTTQNTLEIISSSIVNAPFVPTSISPEFVYNTETLSRINYADGTYKLFFYDINNLIRIDFHKNSNIYRKDFVYVGDVLTQIIETTI